MKNKQIKLLVERYPVLKAIENEVFNAYQILENCYAHGGKLLVAGNGGSAADAEHIVGELMKGFKLPRKPDCGKSGIWFCSGRKSTGGTASHCFGWASGSFDRINERL